MKLIVGLGNPGKKYQNTRHNLGQKIIKEYIETFCKTSLQTKKNFNAEILEIRTGLPVKTAELSAGDNSDKKILAISNDYMNNSGVFVKKIVNFYKISPYNIYIIHDDLDLEIGDYRVQFDRGFAGHNGIKSIIENLGTQQFHRIRLGIGKVKPTTTSKVNTPSNDIPTEDYVLQLFSKDESDIIKTLTPKIFLEIKKITEI